jgi:hypothetical protein
MGAKYDGEEAGIEELRALGYEGKKFLCHHLCNALSQVIGGIDIGDLQMAKDAAWHMVDDLDQAGIGPSQREMNSAEAIKSTHLRQHPETDP